MTTLPLTTPKLRTLRQEWEAEANDVQLRVTKRLGLALLDHIDALSTPPVGGLDREAVARIIDPIAWEKSDKLPPSLSDAPVMASLDLADSICALATPQWLPIPTAVDTSKAPFDGAKVLLGDSEDVCTGWWNGSEWRDHGDIGCAGMCEWEPTHYQPIPRGAQ